MKTLEELEKEIEYGNRHSLIGILTIGRALAEIKSNNLWVHAGLTSFTPHDHLWEPVPYEQCKICGLRRRIKNDI